VMDGSMSAVDSAHARAGRQATYPIFYPVEWSRSLELGADWPPV
jgi:hypothetical protein